MATIGTDTIDVVLPEGVNTSDVSVTTGPAGGDVVNVATKVSDLTITASGTKATDITGQSVSDSTVTATPAAGQTAVVSVETSAFKGSDITNTGPRAKPPFLRSIVVQRRTYSICASIRGECGDRPRAGIQNTGPRVPWPSCHFSGP